MRRSPDVDWPGADQPQQEALGVVVRCCPETASLGAVLYPWAAAMAHLGRGRSVASGSMCRTAVREFRVGSP